MGTALSGFCGDAADEKPSDVISEVTADTYKGQTNNLQQELERLRAEDTFQPLYERAWIDAKSQSQADDADAKSSESRSSFSILQFNILADGLAGTFDTGREGFDKSPKGCLDFNYRGFRILEENMATPDTTSLKIRVRASASVSAITSNCRPTEWLCSTRRTRFR